ncbi:MAG: hypothetical protein ACYC61_30960, partial [Isosphaeraceae bacterium]
MASDSDEGFPVVLTGRSLNAMFTTATLEPGTGTRPLPFELYRDRPDDDLRGRILAVKKELGDALLWPRRSRAALSEDSDRKQDAMQNMASRPRSF